MTFPKHPVSETKSALFHFVFAAIYIFEGLLGAASFVWVLRQSWPIFVQAFSLFIPFMMMCMAPAGFWFHFIGAQRHWADRWKDATLTRGRDVEGFFDKLVEHFGVTEARDLDVSDFLDWATEHGLIRWETYDPVKHGDLGLKAGADQCWVPTKPGP